MLKIALLGRLRVTRGSAESIEFPTRKAGALLAVLAMTPGTPRSRDWLASLLWGGTTDDKARNNLRQCVFVLRRALGDDADVLALRADALVLRPDAVEVDVVAIERIGAQTTPLALQGLVELVRGDLLEGIGISEPGFDDWLVGERERVRALAIDAATRLLAFQEAAGGGQDAIQTALRLLRLDPLQEAAHRTLMRLHAQLGRRGEALRQFHLCEELMSRELGVRPEPETLRLRDAILLEDESDARAKPHGDSSRSGGPSEILVVDDDPVAREMLRGVLGGAGYRVTLATDGDEGLAWLRRQRFDLVISDVIMPALDGLSLLDAAFREGSRVPTVLVTASPAEDLEVRGLARGARDYLRKPISRDVLLLRVANVLRRP